MEQETVLTQEFQKILLNSSSATGTHSIEKEKLSDLNSNSYSNNDPNNGKVTTFTRNDMELKDAFELDPTDFDKWVPFLRNSVEKGALNAVIDELETSIDDNFQDLEFQLLQDSQINDKLETSIGAISNIQSTIQDDLLRDIETFQNEFNQSTNDLIAKKQVYVNNKKTVLKISEAIILINKVVRLLDLSSKCQTLIQERKFFKALQNLDNLERLYLQEFKNYDFDFLKEIYNSVPLLKSITKDECINMVRNSLNSNLGKNLPTVGETIFNVYKNELYPNWLEKKKSMKLYNNFSFNSPAEISTRDQDVLTKIDIDTFFDLDKFYDSIMIFQRLNELPYLLSEYHKEYEFRKNKIIHPLLWKKTTINNINSIPGDISDDVFTKNMSLEFLHEYLMKILGFLLYDINLNKSTDFLLVNNNYNATNEFWDGLTNRLFPYLKFFLNNNLNSEDELEKYKDLLAHFMCILENFKLNIDPLYDILKLTFEKYCNLNIRTFDDEFTLLLNDDDFMPLTVNDPSLYEKIIKISWLTEDKQLQDLLKQSIDGSDTFSTTLPFSPLYPMTCTLSKKTYSKITSFISEFYRHDLPILNRILVSTMETIFNDIVNDKIRSKLDSTSREEISQILINFDYFIIGATEFSNYMSKENILQNPDVEIRLSSIKKFKESRKMTEMKLIELIDSKISDILETVNFEWDSRDIRQNPDISIIDVGQFLEMMFASTLVNLPYSVQTLLIFREFDSLTRNVLDILLNETPNSISQASVHNFKVDIQYLQGIIPRIFPNLDSVNGEDPNAIGNNNINGNVNGNHGIQSPITPTTRTFSGMHNTSGNANVLIENNIKSLQETFTELNQCIELLASHNSHEYSDPEMRMKKYSRIKPDEAKLLLSKVKSTASPEQGSAGVGGDNSNSPRNHLAGSNTESQSNTNLLSNFFNRR